MFQILIYGFPLMLLGFEWGLRTLLIVDSQGFIGPTLAAAGLSYLVPLTKPKVVSMNIPEHPGAMATSRSDQEILIPLVFILIFLFLFAWTLTCYVSIKHPNDMIFGLSTHLAIGGAVYVISLVMIFFKEKV